MTERKRILLIDDDEGVVGFVQMALEDEGYEVSTAENGAVALAKLEQHPPQLILLDLRMPVMNGWEFASAYRERPGPHAPIVIFTAGQRAQAPIGDIAAVDVLEKPFSVDHLVGLVGRHLDRATTG